MWGGWVGGSCFGLMSGGSMVGRSERWVHELVYTAGGTNVHRMLQHYCMVYIRDYIVGRHYICEGVNTGLHIAVWGWACACAGLARLPPNISVEIIHLETSHALGCIDVIFHA